MNRLFWTSALTILVVVCLPSPGWARTWTDSTGKYKIEGEFVKLAEGTVDIRRDDGKLVRIPLEKLSDADQQYVRQTAEPAQAETPFEVAAEPGTPASSQDRDRQAKRATDGSPAGADARTVAVIATGYGTTDEEAKRNAFRNAIEQAVGIYVDATTIVANDALIEDKVLTYSHAFITSFEELKSGASGGLRMKKIQAHVAVQRLAEKLRSQGIKVATATVSGRDLAAEAMTKGQQQQDATALLKEAFDNFPIKCLAATPGKLRIGAADANGRTAVTVPVTVTVAPERYCAFDTSLRNILNAMETRTSSYEFDLSDAYKDGYALESAQPEGPPMYGFSQTNSLSKLHFGGRETQRGDIFGIGMYDPDRSNSRRIKWTVFELPVEHLDFFAGAGIPPEDIRMVVTLRDVGGQCVEEISFLTTVSAGKVLPLPGNYRPPSVVLAGIRIKEGYYQPDTSLSLQHWNMALDGYDLANAMARRRDGDSSVSEFVPLFPIGPLFHYGFRTTMYHCLSPQVRFDVTFQNLDLTAVERIGRVECALLRASQGTRQ